MSSERPFYDKAEVVPQLWAAYEKTPEYINDGMIMAISSVHPLIRKAEDKGLESILANFIKELTTRKNTLETLATRTIGEWHTEWLDMHSMLFHDVFIERGEWRKNPVRFGSPGDEDKHKIPQPFQISSEISALAKMISDGLTQKFSGVESICIFLAQVHYQFIRIHPFKDGNGRIARVLTDQLGLCLGLPPIIAGFPRTNAEKKKVYHDGITGCIDDPSCTALKDWIFQQIEERSAKLA